MRETIRVVVASKNPVKVEAVSTAFRLQFARADVTIQAVNVASGVANQPVGDDETRTGALNRIRAARRACPDADYWVGLEGGVQTIDGELTAFAWMAAQDRHGKIGKARTVTLPLPPAVQRLVADGLELGEANDRVFSTLNSKQGGGAFGLLTNGLHTREGVYAEALTIALVPFVNELFDESGANAAAERLLPG